MKLFMDTGWLDMKLLFITPGSGDNFYCENCMRDRDIVKALAGVGADVTFMPLYLPVDLQRNGESWLNKSADGTVHESPLFFGGVNAWLLQNLSFWKNIPGYIKHLLDSKFVLKLAAKRAGMTDPTSLGDMTLSVLKGMDGRQSQQLSEMVNWLEHSDTMPDAVILSDSLLNGIAPSIKEKLNIPVYCLLQDEDGFVDSLGEFTEPCWQQMRANSKYVEKYIAVSEFYRDVMRDRLELEPEQVEFCYSGVKFDDYKSVTKSGTTVQTIGYLSRICRDNGFDLLVDAFVELKKDHANKNLRMIVTGGSIGDQDFIEQQQKVLAANSLAEYVEFRDEFKQLAARKQFFSDIDLLCVPTRHALAHGRFVLEGLAASVPVLVPGIGVFPEIIAKCGGGKLFDPQKESLADVLQSFIDKAYSFDDFRSRAEQSFDVNVNAEQLYALIRQ